MPTREEVRQELIRSRGFIRGAETQLTKALDALDALDEPVVEPTPEPTPEPEPEPTPEPTPGEGIVLDSMIPAGLTLHRFNAHDAAWGAGWGLADRASGASMSIVSDPTAPAVTVGGRSDPNVGASVALQNWAGVPDGQSPDFIYCGGPSGRRVIVASVMYISSAMLPRNEVKTLEWMLDGASAWLGIYPPGNIKNQTSVPQLVLVARSGGDTHTMPVAGGLSIPLDRWFKMQYEMDLNAGTGSLWIDDVLVSTGPLNFGGSSRFEEFQLGAVWGGGNGNAAPAGAVMKYAATAIWAG